MTDPVDPRRVPPETPRLAVQLYTLRNGLRRGLPHLLDQAAQAGYDEVELFSEDGGFWGLTAQQLRRHLDRLGLRVLAAHVPLDRLERGDLLPLLDDHRDLGCHHLVVPWLPPERRGNAETRRDTFEELGRSLDLIAYRMRARGFRLGYHNHDFELEALPGEPPRRAAFDGVRTILLQSSSGALFAEIDVYWLAFAGLDPVAYIRSLAPHIGILHLKDGLLPRSPGSDPSAARFRPLGDGDLDVPAIVQAALAAGIRRFVVEQDHCQGDPVESIQRSRELVAPLLLANDAATKSPATTGSPGSTTDRPTSGP